MASTYTVPGIYIEEVATGPKPITGVTTTTCGFIGKAPIKTAYLNTPTACNNFPEFCKKFVPDDRAKIQDFALLHAVYGFFFNGGSRCYIVNIGDGTVQGDPGKRTGVHSLEAFDEIALVAAPGATSIADYNALIDHCEKMRNRFAILDGLATFNDVTELTTVGIETAGDDGGAGGGGNKADKARRPKSTSYAAVYTPELVMNCPFTKQRVTVAPSGHIAGIYARTDVDRGVHKAPANVGIRACSGVSQRITEGEQGELNSNYVNCIRYFPNGGIRVWGARTLSNTDPEWRYVNVRRLFLMIEESIKRGTSWVVFEPNNVRLWKTVIRDISAFLKLQWQSGALVGATPAEAFFVKCDGENNPQESIDEGRLIVDIGIAPSKPAEFIIFRIGQWQGGTEVAEAADQK